MVNLCGGCDYVHPKENHPHTIYHQCTKYKVRLFHLNKHPDLVCAPMCDKKQEVPMPVELEPCPFCGMNLVLQLNGWYMHPGNYERVCPMDGFRVDNDARSIDAWNRRTDANLSKPSDQKLE